MLVVTAFGVVAVLLADIGLYGVLAYLVALRGKEIGIRMALGGTPRAVASLVAREGLVLRAAGLAGGALGAAAFKRTLESQLYGVGAGDPAVLFGAVIAVGVIACLACAVPSMRAARIDPAVALNRE